MTFPTTYTQCSWSNTWTHCTINFNIVHQEICCDTVLMAHISTLPLCGFGNPTSRHTILMSPFWTTDGHWVIMLNLHFLESSKAKRLYSSLPLLSTSWVNLQPPWPGTSPFFINPSNSIVVAEGLGSDKYNFISCHESSSLMWMGIMLSAHPSDLECGLPNGDNVVK